MTETHRPGPAGQGLAQEGCTLPPGLGGEPVSVGGTTGSGPTASSPRGVPPLPLPSDLVPNQVIQNELISRSLASSHLQRLPPNKVKATDSVVRLRVDSLGGKGEAWLCPPVRRPWLVSPEIEKNVIGQGKGEDLESGRPGPKRCL